MDMQDMFNFQYWIRFHDPQSFVRYVKYPSPHIAIFAKPLLGRLLIKYIFYKYLEREMYRIDWLTIWHGICNSVNILCKIIWYVQDWL